MTVSEAPIILHGIVCRGDGFSHKVLIMVTNTGTEEDFALLADIGTEVDVYCGAVP
jgi:hypothetical protein